MTWFDLYDCYLFGREMCWPESLSGIEEEIKTLEIIAIGFLI